MGSRALPGQFADKPCLWCAKPSSSTGEHAWPSWLFARFPTSAGPYTTLINGRPVSKRDGTPRRHASLGRVKVPACVEHNAVLARRFEDPARELIRSVLETEGSVVLDPVNARVLSLWLTKTWLLLAHPEAVYADPDATPQQWDLDSIPDDLYGWMVRGDEPPAGLSVWVTRAVEGAVDTPADSEIWLPTIRSSDRVTRFQSKRCGLAGWGLAAQ
jgi:hypothetical protein